MTGETSVLDDHVLTCVAVWQETPDTKSYVFAAGGLDRINFDAGQFLNFTFEIDGKPHQRSYSLSSSAGANERIAISVKRIEGGFVSNWLFDTLKVGDRVRANGPLGVFTLDKSSLPTLLLTAGSGVTPAASIMRSLSDCASDADIMMVHFAQSPQDMIFGHEMSLWARTLGNAKVIPIITRHARHSGWTGLVGRLSRDLLGVAVPDIAKRRVMCCGPTDFMNSARDHAIALGVPSDQFVHESFGSVGDQAGELVKTGSGSQSFNLAFSRSGKATSISAESTILAASSGAGVRIQSSCRSGVCGTCRTKLLKGTVDMKHQGGIKQREIDRGFILACCSMPTSDVEIDL